MQRLEVSGAVRPIYGSLGVKRLMGEAIHMDFWWGSLLMNDHMKFQKHDRMTAFMLILGDG
jgi:hypothetical protein